MYRPGGGPLAPLIPLLLTSMKFSVLVKWVLRGIYPYVEDTVALKYKLVRRLNCVSICINHFVVSDNVCEVCN